MIIVTIARFSTATIKIKTFWFLTFFWAAFHSPSCPLSSWGEGESKKKREEKRKREREGQIPGGLEEEEASHSATVEGGGGGGGGCHTFC